MNWRVIIILILAFAGVFLLLIPEHYKTGITIGWLLVLAVLSFDLARLIVRNVLFTCSNCGHVFKIKSFLNFARPHGRDEWYLKCPVCGEKGWCKSSIRDKKR